MDQRITPSEKSYFMGKCQTCRHSVGLDWTDAFIGCTFGFGIGSREPDMVRRNWSCGRYEYEPGTIE